MHTFMTSALYVETLEKKVHQEPDTDIRRRVGTIKSPGGEQQVWRKDGELEGGSRFLPYQYH